MLYYTQQFRRNGSTMFPETEYQNISIQITSNRSIISHKDYAGHNAFAGFHISVNGKCMPIRISHNRKNILYHRALYQEHPFMCNVYSVEFVSLLTNGLC